MIKSEAQHGQAQNQPAARQGDGAGVESPGSGKIAQLEAMIEGSPQITAQRELAAQIDASSAMAAQRKFVEGIGNSPRMATQMQAPAQLKQKPNHTGLPDNLKSGIENLSGMSMDNVKVHYNSSQPAQLNALAYAQGSDIHVAPGQEQHLPHEAWHVVQQAQGRVRPTMQMKDGVPVNDDRGLEQEADAMGGRALQMHTRMHDAGPAPVPDTYSNLVQRKVGFEFQTNWEIAPDPYGAVEGFASALGSSMSEMYGLDNPEIMGFLTGRLARAPMALAQMGINSFVSWGSWALGKVGGQSIVNKVSRLRDEARPLILKSIPKGFELIRGSGWAMSSDEGEMEFVTDPFGENDFAGLATTMMEIRAFNNSLLGMQNRTYIPVNWYRGVTLLGNLAAVIPKGPNIIGMPQMTAGVDLSQIYAMMRDMGAGNTRNRTTRNRALYLGTVIGNLPAGLLKRSKEYRGLVTLMANYVVQSAGLPAAIPKDIAAIMARSNLGLAFQQTPEYINRAPGNQGMQGLRQQLQHFVSITANAAANAIQYAMVVYPITEATQLFPSADGMAPRSGPTLKEWTDGVVDGDDPMRANYSRLTSRSMSAMNRLENVGAANSPGLIVEFRDLPANIPYTQWANYAANMMRWMQYVNDRTRHRKTHP